MAEIDTVAAALQLAEVAKNLRTLWKNIRNAPEDLNELAEEVIDQANLFSQQPLNNETWRRCHQRFQSCISSLRTVTDELQLTIQTHKKTGPIRIHLKKEQIQKCKERLQRAQTMMILANQDLAITLSIHYGEAILKQTRCKSSRPKPIKSTTAKPGKRLDIQLPLKTVWMCFELSRSLSGINFRMYNLRPNDSPFIQSVRLEKWSEALQMVSNKKASLFDMDERGNTLLHIAASQAKPEICRMLIRNGLDTNYQSFDGKVPLDSLSTAFRHYRNEPPPDSLVTTMRVLRPDEYNIRHIPRHWFDHCSLSGNAIALLKTMIRPSYNSIKPSKRARYAMSTISSDPKSVQILLGDLTIEQAFKLTSKSQGLGSRQLLQNIARCYAKVPTAQHLGGWLDIIKSLIKLESQSKSKSNLRSLYALYIVAHLWQGKTKHYRANGQLWNDIMTDIGRTWLQLLSDCGADLNRYGKAEKTSLQHSEWMVWKDSDHPNRNRPTRSYCFKVHSLIYGPRVDDWKIFVVPHVHRTSQTRTGSSYEFGHSEYEMAGDFWNVIENPELFCIPGAYLSPEPTESDSKVGQSVIVNGPIF